MTANFHFTLSTNVKIFYLLSFRQKQVLLKNVTNKNCFVIQLINIVINIFLYAIAWGDSIEKSKQLIGYFI
jgi:hypothetical protein